MTTHLVLVHALSPLHPGTGQAVGAIDLPIARERPTGIPLVPGSSIKGALRARSETGLELTRAVFGPDTVDASEHAGGVQFSDAHLAFLPVRSVAGTYAWVTSPYLLRRLARDARETGLALPAAVLAPAVVGRCTVLSETLTLPGSRTGNGTRRVVLEDLDFEATVERAAGAPLPRIAAEIGKRLFPDGADDAPGWRQVFQDQLCLVHDDVMALLLETATEVTARVRLAEETKTVAQGALWYEEALPAESVLAGLAVAANVEAAGKRAKHAAAELLAHVATLTRGMVQLGGKANVGRGSCLVRLAGGAV
jgi:CRISPR-associated protein Cmr4